MTGLGIYAKAQSIQRATWPIIQQAQDEMALQRGYGLDRVVNGDSLGCSDYSSARDRCIAARQFALAIEKLH